MKIFDNDNNVVVYMVLITLMISILRLPVVCYAATNGKSENIYSLDNKATIREMLDEVYYKPTEDEVNDFLENKKYEKKYIISYCKDEYCAQAATSRGVALLGLRDSVKYDYVRDGEYTYLNLSGPSDSEVFVYYWRPLFQNGIETTLGEFNGNTEYKFANFSGGSWWGLNSVYPVSNVYNIDQVLPSMLFDKAFSDLWVDIRAIIIDNINIILGIVCLLFFPPLLVFLVKKLRRGIL